MAAAFMAHRGGQELRLARATLGLRLEAAARLAGVSHSTLRRIEAGDLGVGLITLTSVAHAVGLDVSLRLYPAAAPSLRDTGQLGLADQIRAMAHGSWRVAMELPLPGRRAADVVLFGPDEILHVEIERAAEDYQAQYRAADAKRAELQAAHARPVRLVLVILDTARNRARVRTDMGGVRATLPAGSRQVLRAMRSGAALGEDGLLWLRAARRR
jgi:transcriptional regulator with XRE-family HTH domain